MCIVAIAWQLFEDMPLVLLSNRDEFFERPTTPAHHWQDAPIFAGRDNKSGGTWLGHDLTLEGDQHGRWAAVLNFRDGVQANSEQRSRGELVTKYLISELSPLSFARQIELQAYAGFNLIVGDAAQAVVVNNRGYPPTPLHNGLHIFSNGQPDDEWFKCERLRMRVRQEVLPLISESRLFNGDKLDDDKLDGDNLEAHEKTRLAYWQSAAWEVLSDTVQAPPNQLPDTGMPTDLEQALSSICIDTATMPNYGTRTQSIMTVNITTTNNISDQSSDATNNDNGATQLKALLTSREYQPRH